MIIEILNDKEFEKTKKDFKEMIHDLYKSYVFFSRSERKSGTYMSGQFRKNVKCVLFRTSDYATGTDCA